MATQVTVPSELNSGNFSNLQMHLPSLHSVCSFSDSHCSWKKQDSLTVAFFPHLSMWLVTLNPGRHWQTPFSLSQNPPSTSHSLLSLQSSPNFLSPRSPGLTDVVAVVTGGGDEAAFAVADPSSGRPSAVPATSSRSGKRTTAAEKATATGTRNAPARLSILFNAYTAPPRLSPLSLSLPSLSLPLSLPLTLSISLSPRAAPRDALISLFLQTPSIPFCARFSLLSLSLYLFFLYFLPSLFFSPFLSPPPFFGTHSLHTRK